MTRPHLKKQRNEPGGERLECGEHEFWCSECGNRVTLSGSGREYGHERACSHHGSGSQRLATDGGGPDLRELDSKLDSVSRKQDLIQGRLDEIEDAEEGSRVAVARGLVMFATILMVLALVAIAGTGSTVGTAGFLGGSVSVAVAGLIVYMSDVIE